MNKITQKLLQSKIDQINEILGYPLRAYELTEDFKTKANVNTYYIGQAYGGYRIEQMVNDGGGCKDITGRGTKRECYIFAQGMLEALRKEKPDICF